MKPAFRRHERQNVDCQSPGLDCRIRRLQFTRLPIGRRGHNQQTTNVAIIAEGTRRETEALIAQLGQMRDV